jgi:2-phospho-L-lactate transferase/gluconeogenesis factor (CofD/UPF0052 family)
MLGPSDIRKNLSNLLEIQGREGQQLARLLEYRIGSNLRQIDPSSDSVRSQLRQYVNNQVSLIVRRAGDAMTHWIESALNYLSVDDAGSNRSLLEDMSIGNLAMAGAYLESGKDFNLAVAAMVEELGLQVADLLNVTQGENLVLVGVKSDGSYLPNEASIVDKQSTIPIKRVFLLDDYLDLEVGVDQGLDLEETLLDRERTPSANPQVLRAIERADLIVYGPGTQHSSLLPSYMTQGIADAIAGRTNIEKVFIGNISADHDIQSENLQTLLQKVSEYLNRGAVKTWPISSYVTQCFMSSTRESSMPWGLVKVGDSGTSIGVHVGQWTSDGLRHDGDRVANGLATLAMKSSMTSSDKLLASVSVVIPVLDEIQRVGRVLEKLLVFDWIEHGIVPNFIVVDGGSKDGSAELIEKFPTLRTIKLPRGTGRGTVISEGIKSSSGEYVVTFPSDDEYEPEAIVQVVSLLRASRVPIVFGSRVGLCANTDDRLRSIYGGRSRIYLVSKWGGFLLSVVSGVKHRRWIADTLTSVKGFSRDALAVLSLEGKSVTWDMRVIVDASRESLAIAEVPVNFHPRSTREGKKIKVRHGFRAFGTLLRSAK